MSKIDEIRAKMKAEQEANIEALYENEAFATSVAKRMNREENITTMRAWYDQLQAIPAVRLPKLGDISVTIYEADPALFGKELSMVLGVITGLSSIFLDEQAEIAYSIVDTTRAEIEDLVTALGRPSYLDKRNMTQAESITGDYELAVNSLQVFANSVGLHALDLSRFTEAQYKAWFKRAEDKVATKLEEMKKSEVVAEELSSTTLVIED